MSCNPQKTGNLNLAYSRTLKGQTKELLFSELFSLLSSGLDFSHSFSLLIASEEDKSMKMILKMIFQDVITGNSLWYAMQKTGKFISLDYGVIRIGEETGKLKESLEFLTNYYSKKIAQQRMVTSAISYPIIIMCVAIVVVIFMLMVVVPMFEQVYSRMGGELPMLTKWIISVASSFPLYAGVAIIFIIGATSILYLFRENTVVKSGKAEFILRIPLIGNIIAKHYQAHFCKLLYLLTISGVSLLNGIVMLKSVITFYPYSVSFSSILDGLERGESLTSCLEKSPRLYSRKMITLLRVAEETNKVPQMLKRQGDDISKELEYNIKQMGSMLEPILIIIVGVLVSVILISMYMPMFQLGNIVE